MTELMKYNGSAVTKFGESDAIDAMRKRIMTMIPGAIEAPQDVVWAAAQLAVAHGLNPFNGEIYIMPVGKKKVGNDWVDDYRAHIGVKGLRKKARQSSNFMTQFRVMTADEVSAIRREMYDAGDVGVECTLFRMDVATQCARIGIEYLPVIAVGLWRIKAQYHNGKKEWMPDNIPNTWTAEHVAKKRAEINAIKEAFDVSFDVGDPAQGGDDETIEVMARHVHDYDRDRALLASQQVYRNRDGDILGYEEDDPEAVYAEADIIASLDDAPDITDEEGEFVTPGIIVPAHTPTPIAHPSGNGDARVPVDDEKLGKKRKQLHAVGIKAYGDGWNAKRSELCASLGASSSNDLTLPQLEKLIGGMDKLIRERAQAKE